MHIQEPEFWPTFRLLKLGPWAAFVLALVVAVPTSLSATAQVSSSGTFIDDDGNVHEEGIEYVAAEGITLGCNPPANTRYCPSEDVSRGQIALFLARALGLDPTEVDHFQDDDGTVWERGINRIADTGITTGCNPPDNTAYCPNRPVTRGEVAAMLTRAFDLGPPEVDHFSDDDGHIFEGAINRLADARITLGCNPPDNTHYCPDEFVERDQLATLLARVLRSDFAGLLADLLVFGDWGAGTAAQEQVAQEMSEYAATQSVAAIVTTGDNFYTDDTATLMAPYGWASDLGIPFLISWGNHDIETQDRIDQINAEFGDPDRWYSHEWGPFDLIFLDSNQIGSAEQKSFLQATMASSERPTIVVFHHPPYSCSRHGANTQIEDQWVDIFDDDVLLVLNGHDHVYERFRDGGITFLVSGGGGHSLYELNDCPPDHPDLISGAESFHFVALEQLKDRVAASVIGRDGNMIDSFEITYP